MKISSINTTINFNKTHRTSTQGHKGRVLSDEQIDSLLQAATCPDTFECKNTDKKTCGKCSQSQAEEACKNQVQQNRPVLSDEQIDSLLQAAMDRDSDSHKDVDK